MNPVVTTEQNFDSLLVAADHVSRSKSDCYYLNENYLLRAHTSSHQAELIRMGMNNFLVVGDVYRRDEIDKNHYPVFHQVEGVRLLTKHDIFRNEKLAQELPIFDPNGNRTAEKQETHTLDAVYILTQSLKTCLNDLCHELFGKDVEIRWVEAYFPFTHPSWEVEVKLGGEWLEILGCGIMEQKLLANAGADDKIGWAFGLGLERIAMKLYGIPDIRLFWSVDSGFLSQFEVDDPYTPITYKAVSQYPPCINDISFWLPADGTFTSSDFYDLVRSIGGDMVEKVSLVDEFHHLKKSRWSHCYRIVYRHMQKTLTQEEANKIHKLIEEAATRDLRVEIR
jgi:phenylalanyl-tRNA synthetase alpha chain